MLAIASSLKLSDAMFLKLALVGGFLGSVGAWFLGRWLNQKRPFVKLEEWKAQRRVELCSLVDQGQFQISPGAPAPTSKEEGYAQVEELLEREAGTCRRGCSISIPSTECRFTWWVWGSGCWSWEVSSHPSSRRDPMHC